MLTGILSLVMLGAAASHLKAGDALPAPLIPIVLLALLGTFLWMQTRQGSGEATPTA